MCGLPFQELVSVFTVLQIGRHLLPYVTNMSQCWPHMLIAYASCWVSSALIMLHSDLVSADASCSGLYALLFLTQEERHVYCTVQKAKRGIRGHQLQPLLTIPLKQSPAVKLCRI